jgi:hypothetical protein
MFKRRGIIRVIVDDDDHSKVKSYEKFAADFGRIRDITEARWVCIFFH